MCPCKLTSRSKVMLSVRHYFRLRFWVIDPTCPFCDCKIPCMCNRDSRSFLAGQIRCASCEHPLLVGQHLVPAPQGAGVRGGGLLAVCRGCWLIHHLQAGLRSSPPGSEARGVIESQLSDVYDSVSEVLAAQALTRTEAAARSHAWTNAAPAPEAPWPSRSRSTEPGGRRARSRSLHGEFPSVTLRRRSPGRGRTPERR